MNLEIIVVIILFFLSRFLFLATYPHFYDSPEYLKLAQENNLSIALQKSHESIHPIYLLLIQFANKFIPISFVSAFFGLLTFIGFYLLIKQVFNKQTAILSLIPLIFFPHLWLIQTNIMHESVDHFFLIFALLFFDYFLVNKKLINIIVSFVFILFALINFSGNFIWMPVFLGLFVFRKYKKQDDYSN